MRKTNFWLNPHAALRSVVSGLLLLVCAVAWAQAPTPTPTPTPGVIDELAPLPQDTGKAGLQLLLKRLKTTGRLLQTTAHPDDEDGGMLVLQSRGHGQDVTLMTLTRGEGGQNRTGSNLFDELGVLRTLELLESDKYYGVHQRFSTAADFGFSKSAQESLEKWSANGIPGYIPLRDMVRVIRTFRPDVIVSRFSGTERDGHGHHQAAGILTKEAFRAAADPRRFPELNLPPWQAKKLYMGIADPSDYTVMYKTDTPDPTLGMSYVEFAREGLKHQQSQGTFNSAIPSWARTTYYKLVDSVLPMPKPGEHENDFFDGIDTSLPALADRLGEEAKDVPALRESLVEAAKLIDSAKAAAEKDPESALPFLQQARKTLGFGVPPDVTLGGRLDSELDQFRDNLTSAMTLAMQVQTGATVSSKGSETLEFAVPGRPVRVAVSLGNPTAHSVSYVALRHPFLDKKSRNEVPPKGAAKEEIVVTPTSEQIQRPDFHRQRPESDAIYENTAPDPTIPFSRGPVTFVLSTRLLPEDLGGARRVPVESQFTDSTGHPHRRPLAVAPKFSVLLEPSTQVIPTTDGNREVTVEVRSIDPRPVKGTLKLEVPAGWRAEPASEALSFEKYGDERHAKFRIIPAQTKQEGKTQLRAIFESEGRQYTEGYTTVTREDLGTYYYYQPSIQRISIVDVKTQPGLKVGYIMGAGDDIPTVLQQLGIDVTVLSPEELASGDLSKYATIVVGIRAYDNRDDVKRNNPRLLEYVKNGGTLIVQYNAAVPDFNAGKFTPYPMTLSRDRVSVETVPVTILDPQNPILQMPNAISEKDFNDWVQERGLYFASDWHAQFRPLLSCHDPNEPDRKGGLLEAKYGKGTYIYTGYAFFRQLPVGVPGAVRLFVNLLSAGHETPGISH